MIEFIKTYNETFESQLKDYDPNRTIIDFIKNNLDHTMYLWSSNCERTVKSVLTKEGILDKFKVLITRTNVDFIKPNPEGFLYIYEEGTDLNDYLFVGDNIADRRAANSIGIDFFEVNYFKLIA
jgi:HAD superfamily hydrolase (TIGR01549 family)